MTEAPTLSLVDLTTRLALRGGDITPVNGVSLAIAAGETVALVGESGSGKSVTALSVLGLLPKGVGRIVGGAVLFRGRDGSTRDLSGLDGESLRRVRGDEIGMIFQEPMTSLNPVHTIGDQIGEPLRVHRGHDARTARRAAVAMLDAVGIPEAGRRAGQYPHEMSGGMRQRAMIAMALICRPVLLIADEPTTALDVTIQAQILDLMRRLQAEFGMGILFVTHNLGIVAETAGKVAVMYAGRIVETGPVDAIFARPRHPYTAGLVASVPRLGRAGALKAAGQKLPSIAGVVPTPRSLPAGCAFAPRCGLAAEACRAAMPALIDLGGGHASRCLKWSQL